MAAISIINNGEAMSSVRSKLNNVITEINLLDPTDWIDYSATSTIVGWSSFTTKVIKYRVIGKQMFILVSLSGTSNSTSTTFTLPNNNINQVLAAYAYDINNGTAVNGQISTSVNSNSVLIQQNFLSTWTASGTKSVYSEFFIEIA